MATQCILTACPSVREAVHSCLARTHGAVLGPQRLPRPFAGLGNGSTWLLDAGARGPTLTTWHWTAGSLAFAMSRGSHFRAFLPLPFSQQALVPSPFRVRV